MVDFALILGIRENPKEKRKGFMAKKAPGAQSWNPQMNSTWSYTVCDKQSKTMTSIFLEGRGGEERYKNCNELRDYHYSMHRTDKGDNC